MKKALILLGLCMCCSACTAPSLRYKREVAREISAGRYQEAADKITAARKKNYAAKDADLFHLDRAVLLQAAGNYAASDEDLETAQYLIDGLYAKSVSGAAGRLLVNDLTAPYYVSPYEQALTYYYRAMNFLSLHNLSAALVEARKAVFFLDHLRAGKKKGYNDDPFVQYFASLVFESGGLKDDARIARRNAYNAYTRLGGALGVSAPAFTVPENAEKRGEIVIVSSSGVTPFKKTQTMQLAWGDALAVLNEAQEGSYEMSPEVKNALWAGLSGNAVTLAYPVWEDSLNETEAVVARAGRVEQPAARVADISAAAKLDLQEQMPAILARMAARAVSKQVLAVQARHAAAQASGDDTLGDLAGMFASVLGAATERADTRQWFTLPARFYLNRIFVRPGTHEVTLSFRDRYGNIIEEKTFENVKVRRGERVYLHYRAAR